MPYEVTLEGLESLAGDWVQVRAAIRAGCRRGVAFGVELGAAEAHHKHPFQNRTGRLEASIDGRVTGSNEDGTQGVIEATAPYAGFVNDGTSKTKAYPFMPIAEKACEKTLIEEINAGIDDAQRILDR
jgi:HK97 gp10 family phage protein